MVLIPGTALYKEISKLYVVQGEHWAWIGRDSTLRFEYASTWYRIQHTVCTIDGLPGICINPNHVYPVADNTITQVCIYAEETTYNKGAVE